MSAWLHVGLYLFTTPHYTSVSTNDFVIMLSQLAYGVDAGTSYVTTLHILWFSILRYISLQWPHQFKTFTANYGKVHGAAVSKRKMTNVSL